MSDLGQNGVLQVIPPAELEQQLQSRARQTDTARNRRILPRWPAISKASSRFSVTTGTRRLVRAAACGPPVDLTAGSSDANKIQEIKKWGGSEVYARLIAQKCRAASSLLRDIYLGQDQPWAIKAPADPPVPPNILQSINQLPAKRTEPRAAAKGLSPQSV